MSIATSGDNSHGLVFNGAGSGSSNISQSYILENVSASTAGANSHAVQLRFNGDIPGASSSFLARAAVSAQATGAASDGLVVVGTAPGGAMLDFQLGVNAGSQLSSVNGMALRESGMNTTMTVGGLLAGQLDLGNGNDNLTFRGSMVDVTGLTTFDGGTGTDRLSFDSATATFTGNTTFLGFEGGTNATNSHLTLDTATLNVNDLTMDTTSTFEVRGNSHLNAALNTTGRLFLNAGTFTANSLSLGTTSVVEVSGISWLPYALTTPARLILRSATFDVTDVNLGDGAVVEVSGLTRLNSDFALGGRLILNGADFSADSFSLGTSSVVEVTGASHLHHDLTTPSSVILRDATFDVSSLNLSTGTVLAVTGNSTLNNNLTTNGLITMNNGMATDRFTINGDLEGEFTLSMDAVLDATEAADRLMVTGSVQAGARNTIALTNLGGLGADTGQDDSDGLLLVDVLGNSEADNFSLLGHTVQAGAFIYGLHYSTGGDVYLQSFSGISDAAHLYPKSPEIAFLAHRTLLELPQNVAAPQSTNVITISSQGSTRDTRAMPWLRVLGGMGNYTSVTTRGASVETSKTKLSYGGLQVGTTIAVDHNRAGDLSFQVAAHYLNGSQNVTRTIPPNTTAGRIETQAIGLTLGVAYQLPDTTYIKSALAYSRTDYNSRTSVGATGATEGNAMTFMVEAGKRYDLSSGIGLTPWARLGYEHASVRGFVDSLGTIQSSYSIDRVTASLGMRAERGYVTRQGHGSIFGGLALTNTAASGTDVLLQGINVNDRRNSEIFAEVEIGTRWQSYDGRRQMSFSVLADRGLRNTSDYRLRANFDLAMKF